MTEPPVSDVVARMQRDTYAAERAGQMQTAAAEVAQEVGVRPERAQALVRLADLSSCTTGTGEPDRERIAAALRAQLDTVPEWRRPTTTPATPAQPTEVQARVSESVAKMYRSLGMTPPAPAGGAA